MLVTPGWRKEPNVDSKTIAQPGGTSPRRRQDRALLARACESSLLSATVAAQLGEFSDLLDILPKLHLVAGDHRRALEGDV